MKRPWFIAVVGLVLAVCGFGVFYVSRTATYRQLQAQCGPELAWIKKEFQLNSTDFERVKWLHESYKSLCVEMCRQVDEQNRSLALLLQTARNVTPEIEQVLSQAAQLRKQCQTEMLKHFFEVSEVMPTEQGRRYLAWMQAQTLPPTHDSMVLKPGATSDDDRDTRR